MDEKGETKMTFIVFIGMITLCVMLLDIGHNIHKLRKELRLYMRYKEEIVSFKLMIKENDDGTNEPD